VRGERTRRGAADQAPPELSDLGGTIRYAGELGGGRVPGVMEAMAALRDVSSVRRSEGPAQGHGAVSDQWRGVLRDEDLELFVEHGEHDCQALIVEQAMGGVRARGVIGRNKLA